MVNLKWNKLGLVVGLTLSLAAAGCGQEESTDSNGGEQTDTTSVGEEVDYTITGIEPGAGISEQTNNALTEYENLAGWEHEESSTASMLTALGSAIDNEEPIVVAGWTPHYMFSQYDLKFLEDPKGVYGGEENIVTIVRENLEEDMPEAYTILDRFFWETEDMESVMLAALDVEFEEAAQQWVDENQDTVAEWTEGVESVDGTSIELVLAPWDSERASTNVVRIVLEQQGYDVTLTPVDPAVMFQAIATGDADATVAPWLPSTHGAFYEEYESEFEDLGENLTGTRTGLVVPSYMEIESIEDLEPAE